MKVQDMVITQEQAQRLKEMGIAQVGIYSYAHDNLNNKWELSKLPVEALDIIEATNKPTIHPNHRAQFYSAFTNSELGVMLYCDFDKMFTFGWHSFYNRSNSKWSISWFFNNQGYQPIIGWYDTEAQARAAILILLLEQKHINEHQVNQQLQPCTHQPQSGQ